MKATDKDQLPEGVFFEVEGTIITTQVSKTKKVRGILLNGDSTVIEADALLSQVGKDVSLLGGCKVKFQVMSK